MTGTPVAGLHRATAPCRVHRIMGTRRARRSTRCRLRPAAHQFGQTSRSARRTGALMVVHVRLRCGHPCHRNRQAGGLNARAQIARRCCRRSRRTRAWSGQSAPVRRSRCARMVSVHALRCDQIARAQRLDLCGRLTATSPAVRSSVEIVKIAESEPQVAHV